MGNFSKWNAIDLHIHSIVSNEVKGKGDFSGEKYDAKELLEKLQENNVSIFSVTDHNCINTDLYEEIEKAINEEPYNDMSYIIGVELDIYDENIHDTIFHCLCFFDTQDILIVKKSVDQLFKNKPHKERNDKSVFPSIKDVFSEFSKNSIQDILLIPHFNNKTKGRSIPSRSAIEHLNYLCFNAYEDSNNIEAISESLRIYLREGYDSFPFVVFSDCHDLSVYPKINKSAEERNSGFCYILSDINYPFNSVKTAFEEPRMRISIEKVPKMRNMELNNAYISRIVDNGVDINLSPYQNTIIGKFGSGKSLLMQKIKLGLKSLEKDEKYNEFYNEDDSFKIIVDNTQSDSLSEAIEKNLKIRNYDSLQQENFYFKNSLSYDDANNLFYRMNIDFKFNDMFEKLELEEIISENLLEVNKIFKKTGANNFNYNLAFTNEDYFSYFLDKNNVFDYQGLESLLEDIEISFDELSNATIHNVELFSNEEIREIHNLKRIVFKKRNILKEIKKSNFEKNFFEILERYKSNYIDNNSKESKNKLINDFNVLNSGIKKANSSINKFNLKFNKQTFDNLFKKKQYSINDSLQIEYSYNNNNAQYESLNDKIFTKTDRKSTLIKSWVNAVYYQRTLKSNRPLTDLEKVVESYIETYNDMCSIEKNTVYDFYYNGKSVLRQSAGEKSSKFIEIIFELIEKDLQEEKSVILTLDQPEDNIDNDNTYNLIAKKIKDLKLRYSGFQIIVVTHNANVGISADSENIIIASDNDSNDNRKFAYTTGSIENKDHIHTVCTVLEGGINALKKRTIKYGVNIIRKVEKNEV